MESHHLCNDKEFKPYQKTKDLSLDKETPKQFSNQNLHQNQTYWTQNLSKLGKIIEIKGMGGSRIFDWGGPRIDEVRDAGQNVAIFALKSWPIWGGHGPVAPPLEPPLCKHHFALSV